MILTTSTKLSIKLCNYQKGLFKAHTAENELTNLEVKNSCESCLKISFWDLRSEKAKGLVPIEQGLAQELKITIRLCN